MAENKETNKETVRKSSRTKQTNEQTQLEHNTTHTIKKTKDVHRPANCGDTTRSAGRNDHTEVEDEDGKLGDSVMDVIGGRSATDQGGAKTWTTGENDHHTRPVTPCGVHPEQAPRPRAEDDKRRHLPK